MKTLQITLIAIALLIAICIFVEANPFAKKSDISKPSFLEIKMHILLSEVLMHSFYQDYIESINLNGNESVLDFGSGWGTEAKMLSKKLNAGGHVTCLDISPEWINASKKRLKKFNNIDYITGDVTKLQIPDSSFDVIVIHIVWHDIDEIYRNDIMKSLYKLLKKSGKIYIREPFRSDRNISFESVRNYMISNNLKELSLAEASSFWMGKLIQGVYQK